METKTCRKCEVTKPLNEFNQDRQRSNGTRNICKLCARQERRVWSASKIKEKIRIRAENKALIIMLRNNPAILIDLKKKYRSQFLPLFEEQYRKEIELHNKKSSSLALAYANGNRGNLKKHWDRKTA